MKDQSALLLTGEQKRQFITKGYLLIKTGHPLEFHQSLYEKAETVISDEGNPGNNLLACVPELQEVWNDSQITGALTSLLGPNYYQQPHRYGHLNKPGTVNQQLHRDGFFTRRHHTRGVLAFYYPHNVVAEMGPTTIVPESQYFNTRPEAEEMLLCAEAGTVAIVDLHMWHRGTSNVSDRPRMMVKFGFTRMEEPGGNRDDAAWDADLAAQDTGEHEEGLDLLWEHSWNWHHGKVGGSGAGRSGRSIPELIAALDDPQEAQGFAAAYELALQGEVAAPALVEALVTAPDAEQWHTTHEKVNIGNFPRFRTANASHGLAALGEAATPALLELTHHAEWSARASAAETLGDLGLAARSAVPSLSKATRDENRYVRRHAVEALGTAGQGQPEAVPPLLPALSDEDLKVRQQAAVALSRLGSCAEEAVPYLAAALHDTDRYVRKNAVHALRRIGTTEALETLIPFLLTSQWCPITTRKNPY
jgi:hypothetical protein